MITHITGDLFDPEHGFDAIGHGVNVFGVMGAGIAKTFRANYPDMYKTYKTYCDRGLLRPGMTYIYFHTEENLYVYSIASQNRPGADARTEWLKEGLEKVRRHMMAVDIHHLGLPLIGEGVGGLPSGTLDATVQEVFGDTDLDVTIVTWG